MAKSMRDEYERVEELGSGGMATVHKAIQKSLDRPVALKELKKQFHADPVIVERFEREARLGASFQHENIVHIYDFSRTPDLCIVMEYVDGVTLSRVIGAAGALPPDVGVMIALQVANGLEYAHARGLIHRDIKPSNIMIKRNGEVKLMDFGIARSKGLEALTQPGTLVGTPAYMSPEQAIGQPLDVRSDVFSLGVVLYELFTGVKPFQDEETKSTTAKILKGTFISPRSINREIPRSVQRIIKKCLRKKPHRRYDSMQTLARALGKRIKGMDKAASLKRISDFLVEWDLVEAPEADESIVIYKAPRMGTFSRVITTAAVAIAVCTALAAYYFSTRPVIRRPDQALPAALPVNSVATSATVTPLSAATPTLSPLSSGAAITVPPGQVPSEARDRASAHSK